MPETKPISTPEFQDSLISLERFFYLWHFTDKVW